MRTPLTYPPHLRSHLSHLVHAALPHPSLIAISLMMYFPSSRHGLAPSPPRTTHRLVRSYLVHTWLIPGSYLVHTLCAAATTHGLLFPLTSSDPSIGCA